MALLHEIDGSRKIALSDYDPDSHGGIDNGAAVKKSEKLYKELCELQELVYAAQSTPVLIVLQGLDTSGKDGTISHAMGAMNPQSCRVASFKVPTAVEVAHDFLWRVHHEVPARGNIVIFNRSHYEDVLVVRVHNSITKDVCHRRYEHIVNFEKLLADSDTIVLKFFLHISKDEQEKRLLEREKDPTKAWKLSAADWKERELWDAYQTAYEDAINECSRPHAPWYIVPANHKWYRNLAIAEALVNRLRPHRDEWMARLKDIGSAALQDLRAMRQNH